MNKVSTNKKLQDKDFKEIEEMIKRAKKEAARFKEKNFKNSAFTTFFTDS